MLTEEVIGYWGACTECDVMGDLGAGLCVTCWDGYVDQVERRRRVGEISVRNWYLSRFMRVFKYRLLQERARRLNVGGTLYSLK
jgi:hypothetical protein